MAKELAFVLLDKGLALSRAGRSVEILSLSEETAERFKGDEDDRIRSVVGLLLSLKGLALAQLGRNTEALDAVELFLARYDGDLGDVKAMVPLNPTSRPRTRASSRSDRPATPRMVILPGRCRPKKFAAPAQTPST